MIKIISLIAAFAATIPAANWMIGNVGTFCDPNGPCVIPVGFGLYAPSGVIMIGVSLVLRDLVHEKGGVWAAFVAIMVGGVLSYAIAPPMLVIASVTAFTLAELADLSVYSPLRKRGLSLAVLASGVVGAVVDSALFLWLAFGSFNFIGGNILGKVWASVAAIIIIKLIQINSTKRK